MTLSKRAQEAVATLAEGTQYGEIKKLAKQLKRDHPLAQELWSTGSYRPRLLATLIFDKAQLTEDALRELAADILEHPEDERYQLGGWLLGNQLTKRKALVQAMEGWRDDPSPVFRRWFWYHEARKRWTGKLPPPGASAALLDALEARIEGEEPEVQWVMNFCAGWIGVFEEDLRDRCVKLGKRLGLYEGEKVAKNCTPNYLPEFIRIEVAKRA